MVGSDEPVESEKRGILIGLRASAGSGSNVRAKRNPTSAADSVDSRV